MSTISEKLDDLLDNVVNNCLGLFSESQRYSKNFERGMYACSILKPTRRMRANAGIDREILLVSSTFEDQQPRTVKFITEEINSSRGRLETTMAMVVHLDRDGNHKLRNWGREAGLSIIAIYGNSVIESEQDFEKRVSAQLYSHDPFDVSGPVFSDTTFFGRRDEAIDLARKLQTGQIRSCLGIRKIGKTSIINRVIFEIGRTYDCVCVMIDCSRDEVFGVEAEKLLNSVAASVEAAEKNKVSYCSVDISWDETNLVDARNRLQSAFASSERPVVLVFDEVDYITPGSPAATHWREDFNRFWRSLRSVYQECTRTETSLSILIGGVSSYWFTVEDIDGIENAALAFVPEEYLSPMPTAASAAMLKRLGRVSGLSISETAAKYISQSTGNIPFWSRKCGSYLHRNIDYDKRPVEIEKDHVEPIVEKFIQEEGTAIAEVAMTHLFRVHPGISEAAKAVYLSRSKDVPQSLFRTLCRYGIITENGEFSGAMLTAAYTSLVTAQKGGSAEIVELTTTESSLGQWAEDLSVLGARRNILERKLRGIVLNFLRRKAIDEGKIASAKTDILAMVEKTRQRKIQHLGADDLMEKLTWLELAGIISKKWILFEKIFGDRKKFMDNAQIVNQRPDAHAKDFDQADFALYRRALSQIEDGVAKLG